MWSPFFEIHALPFPNFLIEFDASFFCGNVLETTKDASRKT
jgi:hypothetical protein